MVKILVFLFCAVILCQCRVQENRLIPTSNDESEITLAFGSCNKQNEEQVLWDDILREDSDAWIWLGDNIYGDSNDPEVMISKYDKQKSNSGYQKLLETTQIYGIWDDHDYGKNDGGKEYTHKATMRDLMLEFLDVPASNEVWQREGGYQSYVINEDDLSIKLILLDSRYFRDQPKREGRKYLPKYEGSILGEGQWKWLKGEMKNSKEDLILIGNGIQILSSEHIYEKWANFPNERKRLLDLIDQTKKKTILLSGDRHFTELSKFNSRMPIYEFTCSGMTHNYSGDVADINSLRISKFVNKKNYGILKIIKSKGSLIITAQAKGDGGVLFFEEKI